MVKKQIYKKTCLNLKETFAFQKQKNLLNMSGYCYLRGFVIIPVRMYFIACLVFRLTMSFLLKFLGSKICFYSPSRLDQVLCLTLELIVKAKRRNLILCFNPFKTYIFQHNLNLKLFFLKSEAQVMKSICYATKNRNMRLKKTVKYQTQ